MTNKKNRKNKKKQLPDNCLMEIRGLSEDGELMAVTADSEDNPFGHLIYVSTNNKIKPPLAEGDRFIARLSLKKDVWWAKPLARTEIAGCETEMVHGVIEERGDKYYLKSAEKNSRMDYLLCELGSSKVGDFVKIALIGERKFKQARIIKNYGRFNLNKATDLIILEKYGITDVFPEAAIKEAQSCPGYCKEGREDLTRLPLVTIDGDDSKDFDDAVYAEKKADGFRLIVAIADVACYVRPGTELDREAYRRGNSVYLPNMVIPMLPEALCNDLCSLRPKEVRPCLACSMDIDNNGNLLRYEFKRALMKSAARLTYREVQNAFEGCHSPQTAGVFKNVIQPLYEAYFALRKARIERGALELDPIEISVKTAADGQILFIGREEHFLSHEIIEEFMIAANVSAAKCLKKSGLPVMFRIHEKPLAEKLKDIEPVVKSLHLKLPDYSALKPAHLNHILDKSRKSHMNAGINSMIMRLQCQARYSPDNIGHFGLALSDYAHFTSPIRRYADLLVHRALIKACAMSDAGALEEEADVELFRQIGAHLGDTERKAVQAERDSIGRYVSAYLQPSIGAEFEVRISGLTNAGIFVCVEELGADGLIPMRTLPKDNYRLAEGNTELSGVETGCRFILGDMLTVRLTEASPLNGTLAFALVGEPPACSKNKPGKKSKQSKKKRKEKLKSNNQKKAGKKE